MIRTVLISRNARKQLGKAPVRVAKKLRLWVDAVHNEGLENVRRIPGFHDEPLRGEREGQRSIRLSRKYRAIYVVRNDREVEFARIEEVSAHDY